jgi:hypothetical protein
MKYVMFAMAMFASPLLVQPAFAQEGLKFDPAQLCAWQSANNGMDVGECVKLEDDAKSSLEEVETAADETRKTACVQEAQSFASDSGFASYTVYAGCLKDGPGSL